VLVSYVGDGQCPGHVPLGQAARFRSVEPVKVIGNGAKPGLLPIIGRRQRKPIEKHGSDASGRWADGDERMLPAQRLARLACWAFAIVFSLVVDRSIPGAFIGM